MVNSFNELSAENDEIIAKIESIKKQNALIKKNNAEILSEMNTLFESLTELAVLTE
jgi:hypothetical protein